MLKPNIELSGVFLTKGDRTKLKIIKNAIVLFSEKGYSETSIQSIADAIGLSQAAVFKHFKTKKDLLNAVRIHITEDVVSFVGQRVKPEMSAKDRLREYLLGNIDWALKNRDMSQVIFLNYYMACYDDEFHKHLRHVVDLAESRVIELTLACQREDDINSKSDAKLIARQLHDFLIGTSIKLLASTKSKRISAPAKHKCEDFLDKILS